VPSNLILEKVGASRWIARINDRLGHRFGLLCLHPGADQLLYPAFHARPRRGGLFPRHDPLFHLLVPTHHRARIVAGFMAAIPVSIGLGAPVSTALLELDGFWASPGGNGCSSARRRQP